MITHSSKLGIWPWMADSWPAWVQSHFQGLGCCGLLPALPLNSTCFSCCSRIQTSVNLHPLPCPLLEMWPNCGFSLSWTQATKSACPSPSVYLHLSLHPAARTLLLCSSESLLPGPPDAAMFLHHQPLVLSRFYIHYFHWPPPCMPVIWLLKKIVLYVFPMAFAHETFFLQPPPFSV